MSKRISLLAWFWVLSLVRLYRVHADDSLAANDAMSSLSEQEVRTIGAEAYIWGWPMVYLHHCRSRLSLLPSPGISGGAPVAPPNHLSMLSDYISARVQCVPCPNRDVVYGFGILDLSQGPVILQVPDFGNRFWIYQLGDQRTDCFARIGTMYGTKPGHYLIVGPNWSGSIPPGVQEVFRCPTQLGYCIPRIHMDDTQQDRAALQSTLAQVLLYPVDEYRGHMRSRDWSTLRWYPRMGSREPTRMVGMQPERFFEQFPEVLEEVPPLPGEEAMYERFRNLLAARDHNPQVDRWLADTAIRTDSESLTPLFHFRNYGTPLPHHWTTIANGGEFGTDYLTRAAVARSNIFVNREREAKYFYQERDASGEVLSGKNAYQIHFPAGKIPPAKGFWSMTVYDDKHALYANEIERYSIGSNTKLLHWNRDESLTVYLQSHPPLHREQSNWIPVPDGEFCVYLRAYWPDSELLDGSWLPPPILAARMRNNDTTNPTADQPELITNRELFSQSSRGNPNR